MYKVPQNIAAPHVIVAPHAIVAQQLIFVCNVLMFLRSNALRRYGLF
jgi:hypothetical protein